MVALAGISTCAWAADEPDVSNLSLVGVAEVDGVSYASLIDSRNGDHYLPSTRSAEGGLELVGVTGDQSATIRQNGRTFFFRLDEQGEQSTDGAAVTVVVTTTVGSSTDGSVPTPPPGAKLPLVFQSGDMKGMNLSDAQKSAITRLRQQFLAALATGGGAGSSTTASATATASTSGQETNTQTQDESNGGDQSVPHDPRFQNWLTAQEISDATFQMEFGTEAFNLYEMSLQSKSPR
jgi:hypothetical protein